MVFTPEGIFMLVRLEHPLKAYSPIFSTNVGIVRSVKFSHYRKAYSPIERKLYGSLTVVRLLLR